MSEFEERNRKERSRRGEEYVLGLNEWTYFSRSRRTPRTVYIRSNAVPTTRSARHAYIEEMLVVGIWSIEKERERIFERKQREGKKWR